MPLRGTRNDENSVTQRRGQCLMVPEAAAGSEAGGHWCFEPALESGPGVDTYPELLSPSGWGTRGAEGQCSRRPPAARLLEEVRHGYAVREGSGVGRAS